MGSVWVVEEELGYPLGLVGVLLWDAYFDCCIALWMKGGMAAVVGIGSFWERSLVCEIRR